MTTCQMVNNYRRFEEDCCLNLQGVSSPGRESECLDPEGECTKLFRNVCRPRILKDLFLLYVIYVISEIKFTKLFKFKIL
jgi:hypothetical protein